MSTGTINGLHHVTAICGNAQPNYDFYAGTLGLRLVKKTVNFDDPETYHLYYGDGAGTPGSILTFFPSPNVDAGREGTGLVSAVAYATTEAGLAFWEKRLTQEGVEVRGPMQRFDEVYIEFTDPDGIKIEIVIADQQAAFVPWRKSPVAPDLQLRGLHSVTLSEAGYELTHALLTHQLGWTLLKAASGRFRYQAPGGGPASLVDITCQPGGRHGLQGGGIVHHVAFRVDDDATQKDWREKLVGYGYGVSPIKDRDYFRSIYFREPGGVLFELATATPGFAVDETEAALGTALMLPAQYEPMRKHIEPLLPPLRAPASNPA